MEKSHINAKMFPGCDYGGNFTFKVFPPSEVRLAVQCYNAKQTKTAITELNKFSEEIEKAGYGDCMFTKSELRDDLTMHGKYVYSYFYQTATTVNLSLRLEKISAIDFLEL